MCVEGRKKNKCKGKSTCGSPKWCFTKLSPYQGRPTFWADLKKAREGGNKRFDCAKNWKCKDEIIRMQMCKCNSVQFATMKTNTTTVTKTHSRCVEVSVHHARKKKDCNPKHTHFSFSSRPSINAWGIYSLVISVIPNENGESCNKWEKYWVLGSGVTCPTSECLFATIILFGDYSIKTPYIYFSLITLTLFLAFI